MKERHKTKILCNFTNEMEITNSIRKLVAGLGDAKHRRESGVFIAEGTKCVVDTIGAFRCRYLFATAEWMTQHAELVSNINTCVVKSTDLHRMSQLSSQPPVIAVYEIPFGHVPRLSEVASRLSLVLDRVQDPGNLGTIIRIADWFGIEDVFCSHDTVDVYNPKVVQATMGALSRVRVHYVDILQLVRNADDAGIPVYGTVLDGSDIYETPLSSVGLIVMGNEGQGISDDVKRAISHPILIPAFSHNGLPPSSDSLNVAMATAITVAEFRRRQATH